MPLRSPFLAVALLLAAPAVVSATTARLLEEALWAQPSVDTARLRLVRGPDGGIRVTGRVRDAPARDRLAHLVGELSAGEATVAVVVDPRLPAREPSADAATALAAARAAVAADAGTAPHAEALADARWQSDGVLVVPRRLWPRDPAAARRLARLLLAQPGIEALGLADEAAAATRSPFTRPAGPVVGDAPPVLAEDTPPVPVEDTPPAPAEDTPPAPAEDTPPAPVEDTPTAPPADTPPVPVEDPAPADVDEILQDLLARSLVLVAGEGANLEVRVVDGVAHLGGSVPDAAAYERVVGTARAGDGIRDVRGALFVSGLNQVRVIGD